MLIKKVFITSLLLVSYCVASQVSLSKSQQRHKIAGDALLITLPSLALSSTFVWQDENKGTLQFTKAFVGNLALTSLLKYVIRKERPNGENFNSFPSGHTSISFTSAGFLQKRYGWKTGLPAYLIASYVGYSRIKAKKHDKWDVIAGAIIGIGFSYLFTKPYDVKKEPNSISIVNNQPFFGFVYDF